MCKVMNYILGNLDSVNRALYLQNKMNRNVSIFMVIASVYVINATAEQIKMEKQIVRLSKEIEELKQSEGE